MKLKAIADIVKHLPIILKIIPVIEEFFEKIADGKLDKKDQMELAIKIGLLLADILNDEAEELAKKK